MSSLELMRSGMEAAAAIAQEVPELPLAVVVETVGTLWDMARRAQQYNIQASNTGLTDRMQRNSNLLNARAKALCQDTLGLELVTSNDPRGYPYKILLPRTGQYNTWGGPEGGWGIG